jgi:hypothetical protein
MQNYVKIFRDFACNMCSCNGILCTFISRSDVHLVLLFAVKFVTAKSNAFLNTKFTKDYFLSQSGSHTSMEGKMNELHYFLCIITEKVIIAYTIFSLVNISRIALNSNWFCILIYSVLSLQGIC